MVTPDEQRALNVTRAPTRSAHEHCTSCGVPLFMTAFISASFRTREASFSHLQSQGKGNISFLIPVSALTNHACSHTSLLLIVQSAIKAIFMPRIISAFRYREYREETGNEVEGRPRFSRWRLRWEIGCSLYRHFKTITSMKRHKTKVEWTNTITFNSSCILHKLKCHVSSWCNKIRLLKQQFLSIPNPPVSSWMTIYKLGWYQLRLTKRFFPSVVIIGTSCARDLEEGTMPLQQNWFFFFWRCFLRGI